MTMRVFLTGAAGFVGSHVARALVGAGCQVLAFDRPDSSLSRLPDVADEVTVVQGDLYDVTFWLDGSRRRVFIWLGTSNRASTCIHRKMCHLLPLA